MVATTANDADAHKPLARWQRWAVTLFVTAVGALLLSVALYTFAGSPFTPASTTTPLTWAERIQAGPVAPDGTYSAQVVGYVDPSHGLTSAQIATLVGSRLRFGHVSGWTLADGTQAVLVQATGPTQDDAYIATRNVVGAVNALVAEWAKAQ